jgi:predicted transcriptional regulator
MSHAADRSAATRADTRCGAAGALTVAEVMSMPVTTIGPQDSLAAAWDAMRRRGVVHIAVVDRGRVVAVLDAWTVAARWPAGGPEIAHRVAVATMVRPGWRPRHRRRGQTARQR